MTADKLRQKFLDFFVKKGHAIIPSASLIPENDPTVLFTTAGMHPLVPYLMGEKHPSGNRLVSCQKCIRTGDIEEVGDAVHLTFFEMLGNWSLGNHEIIKTLNHKNIKTYWKEEVIRYSWEFLTNKKWLGLNKNKLAISVFAGDNDALFDNEAYEIWKSLGVNEKRIAKLSKENNWWGPAGQTGPCGPDTEMFYWAGKEKAPEIFDPENPLWIEIWNDVFMMYNKNNNGAYEILKQQNVDTGMGLERTLAVLNGLNDIYLSELFLPIIKKIEELSGKKYENYKKEFRIIADHIKAATFILAENIEPSNVKQGYVLRRLIRRAIRYGKIIGINNVFTFKLAESVIEIYKNIYAEIKRNKDFIQEQLVREEEKFGKTIELGLKEFNHKKGLTGKDAFILFSTYGFPFEMTKELAREKGIEINEQEFKEEMGKHQELSRTASAGMFKGGLADAGEISVKYHTATHLLLAALREVIGTETYQKGSNINAERLRFDFNYPEKLTTEQLKKVEDIINEKIKENLPVVMTEMSRDEALKIVKVSFDPSKYGDVVKVYKIGNFSTEVCGGPHVAQTGVLGYFKIIKEEASSAGVRRIKAVLE